MKVKELIFQLNQLNKDADVFILREVDSRRMIVDESYEVEPHLMGQWAANDKVVHIRCGTLIRC